METNAMKETLTREAWEALTAGERRSVLKVEQAKEYSGLRAYPTTCRRVMERIPEDWWGRYTAEHIGQVMRLLHQAYSDGKND